MVCFAVIPPNDYVSFDGNYSEKVCIQKIEISTIPLWNIPNLKGDHEQKPLCDWVEHKWEKIYPCEYSTGHGYVYSNREACPIEQCIFCHKKRKRIDKTTTEYEEIE